MRRELRVASAVTLLVVALFALSAWASDAELYFATDTNGQNRVTAIQEGDSVWIAVYDPDENIDCDVRDKIWTDIKVMDPKTGAYIVWISYPAAGPGANAYGTATYVPFRGHLPGNAPGHLQYDYLEETGSDTGLFVSSRAFQVGTRENFANPMLHTHVVDNNAHPDLGAFGSVGLQDFQFGHYQYWGNKSSAPGFPVRMRRGWWDAVAPFPTHLAGPPGMAWPALVTWQLPNPAITGAGARPDYLVGRFENNDTLTALYIDQNDDRDIACAMAKIIDTEATCSWDQDIYADCNSSARVTIIDMDENLDCNRVESVPVFIIVNPGSWNPVDDATTFVNAAADSISGWSPTTFCALKATGGIDPTNGGAEVENVPAILPLIAAGAAQPIRWFTAYNSGLGLPTRGAALNFSPTNAQPLNAGTYYMQYPSPAVVGINPNVVTFDTSDLNGKARVMFWASETGVSTGVFELNFNQICDDLGFNSLDVNDVLVAYYLDPNDEDDFTLCTAYISERSCHSITSFTDATRADQEIFWIGRDPVYVQVIDSNANVDPCCPEQVVVHICDPHQSDDAEWTILDETSSNSPVFFSTAGMQLLGVWDALGIGWWGTGDQLVLDNWKLEAYNEDSIYVRYNDQIHVAMDLGLLGDLVGPDPTGAAVNAAPPEIRVTRVDNDLSFDTLEVASTEVFGFDGSVNMWFLDRQGNRVTGYVNSDCIFIEVLDPDQDEDQMRRERIDSHWAKNPFGAGPDAGDNFPFGPRNHNVNGHLIPDPFAASIVALPGARMLGNTDIFNPNPPGGDGTDDFAKLYVLNPRTGLWAGVDLLETGVATGDFVSVICIDLVSQYVGVPTLGVIPGDTIVAVYQDPTNHSDSAWICIKVGCGGGGTPQGTGSTTTFVDADGNAVESYLEGDLVYVVVTDPSHENAPLIADALTVDGQLIDLMALGGHPGVFKSEGLALDLVAGSELVAEYVDPADPIDRSSDTITVIASELDVVRFFASPNPFDGATTFGFEGSGVATVMSVTIYDLAGKAVWSADEANVTGIDWDGTDSGGIMLANGGYIYVITATDGTNNFDGRGTVFINR
ncbi:FlgD immunoglobulin-like domain containing protein [Candidatus Bipolaricaulota bacterium]